MISSGVEAAWYVYGVVPADAGLDGLDVVSEHGLSAIVGRVDLAEFGEEPLRRNLENRAWLEQAVASHDDVLSGVVGAAPLVPFRFGTVFRDEAGVREMLRARRAELRGALDRLRGHVELGVKVFLVDTAKDEGAKPATGRDYLLQKQRARDAATNVQAEALEQVKALHEHLASLADGARANPPQPPELSGRRDTMLLNAAYLVSTDEQPEFVAAADDPGDERLEVVVTGPWPAYNFVQPEEAR
ncbi:MAG: GvpL/GvpF family gas vesicle protein [Gaiellaceae bacterium]